MNDISVTPLRPSQQEDPPNLAGSRGRAVAVLEKCLRDREAVVLLSGPAGVGKSVVLRSALAALAGEPIRLLYLTNPSALPWSQHDLAVQLLRGESVEASANLAVARAIAELTAATGDAQVVIAVDDAHTLSNEAMEMLLLIASEARGGRIPPQLVLAGRGAFWERRWRGELQLIRAKRVTLEPLAGADAAAYIGHHLNRAGGSVDDISPGGLSTILRHSGGLPGRINRILPTAISIGVVRGGRVLSRDIVRAAIASLAPAPGAPRPDPAPVRSSTAAGDPTREAPPPEAEPAPELDWQKSVVAPIFAALSPRERPPEPDLGSVAPGALATHDPVAAAPAAPEVPRVFPVPSVAWPRTPLDRAALRRSELAGPEAGATSDPFPNPEVVAAAPRATATGPLDRALQSSREFVSLAVPDSAASPARDREAISAPPVPQALPRADQAAQPTGDLASPSTPGMKLSPGQVPEAASASSAVLATRSGQIHSPAGDPASPVARGGIFTRSPDPKVGDVIPPAAPAVSRPPDSGQAAATGAPASGLDLNVVPMRRPHDVPPAGDPNWPGSRWPAAMGPAVPTVKSEPTGDPDGSTVAPLFHRPPSQLRATNGDLFHTARSGFATQHIPVPGVAPGPRRAARAAAAAAAILLLLLGGVAWLLPDPVAEVAGAMGLPWWREPTGPAANPLDPVSLLIASADSRSINEPAASPESAAAPASVAFPAEAPAEAPGTKGREADVIPLGEPRVAPATVSSRTTVADGGPMRSPPSDPVGVAGYGVVTVSPAPPPDPAVRISVGPEPREGGEGPTAATSPEPQSRATEASLPAATDQTGSPVRRNEAQPETIAAPAATASAPAPDAVNRESNGTPQAPREQRQASDGQHALPSESNPPIDEPGPAQVASPIVASSTVPASDRPKGNRDVAIQQAMAALPVMAATQARPRPATRLSPEAVSALVRRGEEMLGQGDVLSARLFFERAAAAGSGQGATGAGKTYDPVFLATIDAPGLKSDAIRAIEWYRTASTTLGDREADERLKALIAETGH